MVTVVQLQSHVKHFANPWTEAHQTPLSTTISQSLLKRSLSRWYQPTTSSSVALFSCPQCYPASIFSSKSALRIRWSTYWSFSFSINPSNEHSGLISFRTDWFDLLAVQGTLKSLLQHHNLKASIFHCSAFFMVQLSHPYITTGKIIALTRRTFVGK